MCSRGPHDRSQNTNWIRVTKSFLVCYFFFFFFLQRAILIFVVEPHTKKEDITNFWLQSNDIYLGTHVQTRIKEFNYEAVGCAFEFFSFAFNLPLSPDGFTCGVSPKPVNFSLSSLHNLRLNLTCAPGLWQLPTAPSHFNSVSSRSFVYRREISENTNRVLSAPAWTPPRLLEALSFRAESPARLCAWRAPCLHSGLSSDMISSGEPSQAPPL